MKERLDAALVERGLATGRDRAKGLILSGQVYVNDQIADKVGQTVLPDDIIEVRGETLPFVSRGGLKLQRAIEVFGIKLNGAVCADLGASTGGFTDCMLQHGAAKVYAVDVGYGQLAWTLRQDSRVVVMERTNARHLTREQIPDALDFVSMDLSFISLTLILPAVFSLLGENGEAVCLIKPQFEAGREQVGKKGVVRDRAVHAEVVEKILLFAENLGFFVYGIDYSPIKGPQGNIEYLMYISKKMQQNTGADTATFDIMGLVEKAHAAL